MAIVFALGCLCCAAINDFIFKLFSRNSDGRKRSCGIFVCIVGWVMVIAYSILRPPHSMDLQMTIPWGCLSGLLSLISNVLVIESMRYLTAGVSSTIFRMNMVLVVIGAWLFLGEQITPTLLAGTLCALCSILAFIPKREKNDGASQKHAWLGFSLAVVACVLRACMSLSYKYAFSHGADENGVAMLCALAWALGGIVITLAQEHKLVMPTPSEWKISLTSGVFTTAIIVLMARMNACGNASVVNPIAQMSFLGTMMLSCLILKEKITPKKAIALTLGCAAVIFLSL